MSSTMTEAQAVSEFLKMSVELDHASKPDVNELSVKDADENTKENSVISPEEFKPKVKWFYAIVVLILHITAVYGLLLMVFRAKFLTIVWFVVSLTIGTLGITMGAHRLYCHRTFKANKWIQMMLVAFQTMGGENSVFVWTRVHRQHHKHTDTDADPHNSKRGFFFCHMGWLIFEEHPELLRMKKTIDMSDLLQQPIVMFQKKYYKEMFLILSVIIPTLIPYYGWNESLWNSFFICSICRWMVCLNAVFSVNSIAHRFGTRPFNKEIAPSENAPVSFFALGEGWHNYHHTFPWDYRASEYGQDFNFTTTVIDFCAMNGWVYDVKKASPELVEKYSTQHGDGSHPLYGSFSPDKWMYRKY